MSSVKSTGSNDSVGSIAQIINGSALKEAVIQNKYARFLAFHMQAYTDLKARDVSVGPIAPQNSKCEDVDVIRKRIELHEYVFEKLIEFGNQREWNQDKTPIKMFILDLKPYDSFVQAKKVSSTIVDQDLSLDLKKVREEYRELLEQIVEYNTLIEGKSSSPVTAAASSSSSSSSSSSRMTTPSNTNNVAPQTAIASLLSCATTSADDFTHAITGIKEEIRICEEYHQKMKTVLDVFPLTIIQEMFDINQRKAELPSGFSEYVTNLLNSVNDEKTLIWEPFFELSRKILQKLKKSGYTLLDQNDLSQIKEYESKRAEFLATIHTFDTNQIPYVYKNEPQPADGHFVKEAKEWVDLKGYNIPVIAAGGGLAVDEPEIEIANTESEGSPTTISLFKHLKNEWLAKNREALIQKGKIHIFGQDNNVAEYSVAVHLVTNLLVLRDETKPLVNEGEAVPEEQLQKLGLCFLLEKTFKKKEDNSALYLNWFKRIQAVELFRAKFNCTVQITLGLFGRMAPLVAKVEPVGHNVPAATPFDLITFEALPSDFDEKKKQVDYVADYVAATLNALNNFHNRVLESLNNFKPFQLPIAVKANDKFVQIMRGVLAHSEALSDSIKKSGCLYIDNEELKKLNKYLEFSMAFTSVNSTSQDVITPYVLIDQIPPPDDYKTEEDVGEISLKGKGITVTSNEGKTVLSEVVSKGRFSKVGELIENLHDEWEVENSKLISDKSRVHIYGKDQPLAIYSMTANVVSTPLAFIVQNFSKRNRKNGIVPESQMEKFILRMTLHKTYKRIPDSAGKVFQYFYHQRLGDAYNEKFQLILRLTMAYFEKIKACQNLIEEID